ncbi:hypothetical protein ACPV5U_08620 [Vibrio mediterranei]
MQVNIQSALQAVVILAGIAYGYGVLDNQVQDNTKEIVRVEQKVEKRNKEFMDKFDAFIVEQRLLNQQIVKNSTNQDRILKKLDL